MERYYFLLFKCPICDTFYERTIVLSEDHLAKDGFSFQPYCNRQSSILSHCSGTLQLVNVEVKVI